MSDVAVIDDGERLLQAVKQARCAHDAGIMYPTSGVMKLVRVCRSCGKPAIRCDGCEGTGVDGGQWCYRCNGGGWIVEPNVKP